MGATDTFLERLLVRDERFTNEQIVQTLQMLVEQGVKHEASGIHIEPRERHILVRYRIGAALSGMHKLPMQAYANLMQQLKLLAGLDPLEIHAPQEGGYEAIVGGNSLHIGVSVIPVLGGEKAVLHLTPQGETSELETLGFWGEGLARIRETLALPYGLMLVAGQRGSGITTTLRSLQHLLHAPANSNITTSDNLYGKVALESAVNTALQGRIVLAGIHAEGTINSLVKVRALPIEPFLLASTFRLATGQRLIRRLCVKCRERHPLDEDERQKLQSALGITTSTQSKKVHTLERAALDNGIGEAPLSSTPLRITHLWRANKDGCEACHNGFKGRVAITEVLTDGKNLQKKLLATNAPTTSELHGSALKDGFVPLELDGLIKSLRGLTALEEVLNPHAT